MTNEESDIFQVPKLCPECKNATLTLWANHIVPTFPIWEFDIKEKFGSAPCSSITLHWSVYLIWEPRGESGQDIFREPHRQPAKIKILAVISGPIAQEEDLSN